MSDAQNTKPIKVTISDLETGEVLEERVLADDYAIITAGRRYVKSVQMMGKTVMVAVALAAQPTGGKPDGE